MVAKVGWLVSERIIYSQSIGTITLDTVKAHADYLVQLLNSGSDTRVHLIIDTREVQAFNVELPRLNAHTLRYLTHPRLVWNIDVTHHTKNQVLGRVVSTRASIRWIHFRQLEDALNHLSKIDETLESLDMKHFDLFAPSLIIP